jgi:predicted RNase H-like nuclease (RuvC/YqgF family)
MFEQVKTLIPTKQSTKTFFFVAEIVMHEERVERHLRGVQETLEQTDAEYSRMLTEFSKSINTYKDEIQSLEEIFLNVTTSGALHALENRLKKQRNAYMEKIRTSLRTFRQRFDELIHYLRQANVKFRKSFK